MVSSCCICKTTGKLTSYFVFPNPKKDGERLDKWIMAVGQHRFKGKSKEDIHRSQRVCERHFNPKHILASPKTRIKLHKDAVPCLLLESAEKTEENSTPSPPVQNSVIISKGDQYFHYAKDDARISLILKKQFSFLQEQLPLKIAAGEYKVVREIIYKYDDFRDATLLTKVHCTSCNRHLGTSPIAQFDRFVHPVLNTLMCKCCFEFYNSVEFTKDEDGSEMYCKWCGQGGTVMCCSDCPLVFCKLCVERNFGERVREKIAKDDSWLCFKCNPSQLSKLHIMCSAVHEYTLQIIDKAMRMGEKDLIEKDISICCKNSSTKNKRKHIVLDDEVDMDEIPNAMRKRMKICADLNASALRFTLADGKSAATPQSPPFVPSSSPPLLVPALYAPLRSQYTAISPDPPALAPVMPVIAKVEGNVRSTPNESYTMAEICTLNYELMQNALDKSQEVIDNFIRRCEDLRQTVIASNRHSEYAALQNRMQDALYQCSNMMLETRNVLAFEYRLRNRTITEEVTTRALPADNKTAVTECLPVPSTLDGADEHSTIILPNNEPLPSELKDVNQLKRELPKSAGSQLPILLRPTLTPVKLGLPPVLLNHIHPLKTVRLVNSNVKKYSIAISQVGSVSVGNIMTSSMQAASKNSMYDKQVMDVNKANTADKDPLAMSDDESEGSCFKTEIDMIDEPFAIKVEEDEI